eukprot:279270_1
MSALIKKDIMINKPNKMKRCEYGTSEFIQDFKILLCDQQTFIGCDWSPNHNKTKGCMLRKSNKYLFANHIYTNHAVYSINDKNCFNDSFTNIINTIDKLTNTNDKCKIKFGSPYINHKTWTVIATFTHPIDKRLRFEHDGFNNNCIITHMPTKKKYAYLYKRWSKYSKLKSGVRITKINNEPVVDTAHDYIQSLLDDVQKHDTYTITFEYGRLRWYKSVEYSTAAKHDSDGNLMQNMIDIKSKSLSFISIPERVSELPRLSADKFRYCGQNILINYNKSTVLHQQKLIEENDDTKIDEHKVKSSMELALPTLIKTASDSITESISHSVSYSGPNLLHKECHENCAYGSHFIPSGEVKWTVHINTGKNIIVGIYGVTNNYLLSNEIFTCSEYGYGMNNDGEIYNNGKLLIKHERGYNEGDTVSIKLDLMHGELQFNPKLCENNIVKISKPNNNSTVNELKGYRLAVYLPDINDKITIIRNKRKRHTIRSKSFDLLTPDISTDYVCTDDEHGLFEYAADGDINDYTPFWTPIIKDIFTENKFNKSCDFVDNNILIESLMKCYSENKRKYIDVAGILTQDYLYFVNGRSYQIWDQFKDRTKIDQVLYNDNDTGVSSNIKIEEIYGNHS